MDYEKMWKTLKWDLTVKIGEMMKHTDEGNKKYKSFAINILRGILNRMNQIEKEG